MNNKESLLRLFQNTTGKTIHVPKVEPSAIQLVGYQYPRCNRFQLRYKE